MRVALVHDYLNQYGGGERVLETLMEMFPEAPIYTAIYDEEKTFGRFAGRDIKTSFLSFPFAARHHRLFIPFMPFAIGAMKVPSDYDLIISDTAGFAKGIGYDKTKTQHLSYIHTPLRYAWEQKEYLSGLISNFQLLISKPILNYLKNWDYKAGQKPDILLANSDFIAEKVRDCYNREAKVVYPPVDTKNFFNVPNRSITNLPNYYLAVGRMLHYKRFDLAIEAFAKLGLPLKIVGSGPELENLKAKSYNLKARNIEFLSFLKNEDELRALYSGAKALIFPQVEDFGLVAAEAQACGAPVIAYAAGGALEIVKDGESGALFGEQTPEALIAAVRRAENINFNRQKISESARRFSKENFKKGILTAINKLI